MPETEPNREKEPTPIRNLELADYDDMVELNKSNIEHKDLYGSGKLLTRDQIFNDLQKGIEMRDEGKNISLAVDKNSRMAGEIVICHEDKIGHITSLNVLHDERGKGIGGSLLDEAIREAIEKWQIKQVKLETCEDNSDSLRLYEKRGFIKTKKKPEERRIYDEIHNWIELEKVL